MGRSPSMVLLLVFPVAVAAQTAGAGDSSPQAAPTEAAPPAEHPVATTAPEPPEPQKPPVVVPQEDPLGRDRDPMVIDADAGVLPQGFSSAGSVGGNPGSFVKGGELPPGTNAVVPIAGGVAAEALGWHADFAGFIFADFFWQRSEFGDQQSSFRPREIEINIVPRYSDTARLMVDFSLDATIFESRFEQFGFGRLLVEHLIGEAFVEWTPSPFVARLGKMDAPFGVEPLDPTERLELSRSSWGVVGTPDVITGLYASAEIVDVSYVLSAHAAAFNGWDVTIDDNTGKSFLLGIPHKLWKLGDNRWLYSGSLDIVLGAERQDSGDIRWLLDYSATIRPLAWLWVLFEMGYAQEKGLGLKRASGIADGSRTAQWWGGQIAVQYRDADFPVSGGFRADYVHDPDLVVGLPPASNLPSDLTTLVGFTLVARYELIEYVDVGIEYRVDSRRGDVERVGLQRNFPFTQLSNWFNTHQISVGAIGRF